MVILKSEREAESIHRLKSRADQLYVLYIPKIFADNGSFLTTADMM